MRIMDFAKRTACRVLDVRVYHHPTDKDRHTMLELSGAGCRTMEHVLRGQGMDWYDFLRHIQNNFNHTINRLDIAIDDFDGILSVPELTRKTEREELISKYVRTFNSHDGGRRLQGDFEDEWQKTFKIFYFQTICCSG